MVPHSERRIWELHIDYAQLPGLYVFSGVGELSTKLRDIVLQELTGPAQH